MRKLLMLFVLTFFITGLYAQTQTDPGLAEITKPFSLALSWDQPIYGLGLQDSDAIASYNSAVVHSFGLLFTYYSFGIDASLMSLYLLDYEDAESMLGDINIYYAKDKIINVFSYKSSIGHYSYDLDDEDTVEYFPDLVSLSVSNSFGYQLLGDVSLRNIYLHNEYQSKTKAGLLGKVVLDYRYINDDANVIPSYAQDDFQTVQSFSSLSAFAVAPMLSGLVNFNFLTPNTTIVLGLSGGPNFIYNYGIKAEGVSSTSTSVMPKLDILLGYNVLSTDYYLSMLSNMDLFMTEIGEDAYVSQIDLKMKILLGVRF